MKSFAIAIAAASALCVPLAAFSQTDATLTRAQVRAELEQLERVGYDLATGDNPNYPTDIQTAEARLQMQKGATGYGGAMTGSSGSGSPVVTRPASADEMKQIYFGGQ